LNQTTPTTSSTEPGFRLGYRPWLDGLRGISILAVMVFHAGLPLTGGGFLGVDVFFVLSGFLITCLLIQEWDRAGSVNLKLFYLRRAARLLPALLLFLAGCCVYAIVLQTPGDARVTYRAALLSLFYVGNWVLAQEPGALGALGHTWSLSVEEQFYLAWPLLLSAMLWIRLRRKWIIVVVSLIVLGSAAWRLILAEGGAHFVRLYCATDTRADALLAGCLAGLLLSWNLIPSTRAARLLVRVAAIAGLLTLLCLIPFGAQDDRNLYRGLLTLVALGVSAIIIDVFNSRVRTPIIRILEWPALVWIGRISYGLYLWHYTVFQAIGMRRFEAALGGRLGVQVLRFAATFAIAALSFYVIERRFLVLKKRFEPGAAAAGAAHDKPPAPVQVAFEER
jgi:peptidoglycan/LPS O-acetylase OafA/YrhL